MTQAVLLVHIREHAGGCPTDDTRGSANNVFTGCPTSRMGQVPAPVSRHRNHLAEPSSIRRRSLLDRKGSWYAQTSRAAHPPMCRGRADRTQIFTALINATVNESQLFLFRLFHEARCSS